MGSFGLLELIIMFVMLLVVLAGSLLWVWMLIDCVINEPSGTNKIVWLLVILLANFIGAVIYFLVRRPARRRAEARS